MTLQECEDKFEELEKLYKQNRRIQFQGKVKIFKSLDKFINAIIRTYVNKYYSVYVDAQTVIQCNRHKHRSLGDLYLLTIAYIPDLKLKDMINCLMTMLKEKRVNTIFCCTIQKQTFFSPNYARYYGTFTYNNPTDHLTNGVSLKDFVDYHKLRAND